MSIAVAQTTTVSHVHVGYMNRMRNSSLIKQCNDNNNTYNAYTQSTVKDTGAYEIIEMVYLGLRLVLDGKKS